jgi:Mannan-binding protein
MLRRIVAISILVAAAEISGPPNAGTARASSESFCGELGGAWDGQYCHTTVTSERNGVPDIKFAVPADLVDSATTGPTVRDYLRTLVGNWRNTNAHMAADSYGEENYEVFRTAICSARSSTRTTTPMGPNPTTRTAPSPSTWQAAGDCS